MLAVPRADAWDIPALAMARQARETGIPRGIAIVTCVPQITQRLPQALKRPG